MIKTHNKSDINNLTRSDYYLWIIVFILSFIFYYKFCLFLNSLGVFKQYNIMFDADPNMKLAVFARGWGGHDFKYAWLGSIFSIPIRAIWVISNKIGFFAANGIDIRTEIALLILPISGSIRNVLAFATFRELGLNKLASLALSLLVGLSLSGIVFGSVPEHYGLSGAVLFLLFFMAARWRKKEKTVSYGWWIFAAATAIGFDLFNAAAIGLLLFFFYLQRSQGFWRSGLKSFLFLGASLVLSYAVGTIGNKFFDLPPPKLISPSNEEQWVNTAPDHVTYNLIRFPYRITQAYAPSAISVIPSKLGIKNDQKYKFEFSLEPKIDESLIAKIRIIAFLASLAIGGAIIWITRKDLRGLLYTSLSLLAFNAFFSSIWGHETFLFSQYWLFIPVFMMSGLLLSSGRWRYAAYGLFAIMLLSEVTLNMSNIQFMRQSLEAVKVGPNTGVQAEPPA